MKQLSTIRETSDAHRIEAERLNTQFDEFKAKHETDVAQHRRERAALMRDKSDLSTTLEQLKKEAERKEKRGFGLGGSPLTPEQRAERGRYLTPSVYGEGEDDIFSDRTGGASTNRRKSGEGTYNGEFLSDMEEDDDDASPLKKPFMAPNHPANEVEALQQRLSHAQRQISTLKGTLQREKERGIEFRKQAGRSPASSAVFGEGMEQGGSDEEGEAGPNGSLKKPRRGTPIRVGAAGRGRGRARGRGGMLLQQRLEAARNGDDDDDDDADTTASPPPPVPSLPQFLGDAEADDQDQDTTVGPEPEEAASNRTSIDGRNVCKI